MLQGDVQEYNRDRENFFKAATASGILIALFYVLPNLLTLTLSFVSGVINKDINIRTLLYRYLPTREQRVFVDGLFQIAFLLLAVFIVTRFYKFKPFSVFKKYGLSDEGIPSENKMKWGKIILLGTPVMYMVNFSAGLVVLGITKFIENVGFKVPSANFELTNYTPLNIVLYFVRLCVLAPFIEEFLMRGCMLKILKPFGKWFAIITTAIMFGLLHNNIGQGVGAVIVGIFFGMIAIKTESIYPTIILHAINNFLVSLLSALHGRIEMKTQYLLLSQFMFALVIFGVLIVIVYGKKFKINNDNTTAVSTGEYVKRYVLNPAVLLYLAVNLFIFVLLFFQAN